MTHQDHLDTAMPETTTIGKGCRIKGDIEFDGDAAIFGSVEGQVEMTGSLHLGSDGAVRGSVRAASVELQGQVEGDITASGSVNLTGRVEGDVVCGDALRLGDGAALIGNLYAASIAIAEGATYRGQVIIGPDAVAEAGKHTSAGKRSQPAREHHTNGAVGGQRETDREHRGEPHGNGQGKVETDPNGAAVSGLLRRRHELLSRTAAAGT